MISDDYFNTIIISLKKFNKIEVNGNCIKCEAGANLIQVSSIATKNSLTGLEFASGIPGTIGGAIFQNAGAYLSDMASVIENVTVLDDELNIINISNDECLFGYRSSLFKTSKKYIILSCEIKLQPGNIEEIKALIKDRLNRRLLSQPLEYPSAGSVFRNPENNYAGKLIEDLNLKGFKIGGAAVSEKHANFIINYDHAKAIDIKNVIDKVKKDVKDNYNIDLICEIEFVNFKE